MSRNYYYLVAGFPELSPDQKKLPFSLLELKQELAIHLHKDDYQLVSYLFLEYDNQNLLNLLLKTGKEFNPAGNFTREFLADELKDPEKLPGYMKLFLENYKNNTPVKPKLSTENQLAWHYYDFLLGLKNDFLYKWFWFERDVKNIFAIFNSRKYGFDLESQVIGDYELTENARRSLSKDFGLANEYSYIEDIAEIYGETDFVNQEMAIDQLKWEYLNDMTVFSSFTLEKVLSLVIKFMITERWTKLEPAQGQASFSKILHRLEHSIEFSKDFNINGKRS